MQNLILKALHRDKIMDFYDNEDVLINDMDDMEYTLAFDFEEAEFYTE